MLEHRQYVKKRRLDKHQKRCNEIKKKYIECELKKQRIRSKSIDDLWEPVWKRDPEAWDELDSDLFMASAEVKYYTDEVLTPGLEDGLMSEKRRRWHEKLVLPSPPFTEHLENKYLELLAHKFEAQYNLTAIAPTPPDALSPPTSPNN